MEQLPPAVAEQLAAQDAKLDAIYRSVEKTRKYLLIIMWSSLAMIVLPAVAIAVIAPILLAALSSSLGI